MNEPLSSLPPGVQDRAAAHDRASPPGEIATERDAWRTSTHEHRVAFSECDPAGIAHYSSFYRWFDESVHTLLRSIGWDWHRTRRELGWIGLALAQAEARFLRPVTPGMILLIETRIEHVEKRRVHVTHRVMHRGELACEGREARFVGMHSASDPDRIHAIDLPVAFVEALRNGHPSMTQLQQNDRPTPGIDHS